MDSSEKSPDPIGASHVTFCHYTAHYRLDPHHQSGHVRNLNNLGTSMAGEAEEKVHKGIKLHAEK